jgi:hypothetical protein
VLSLFHTSLTLQSRVVGTASQGWVRCRDHQSRACQYLPSNKIDHLKEFEYGLGKTGTWECSKNDLLSLVEKLLAHLLEATTTILNETWLAVKRENEFRLTMAALYPAVRSQCCTIGSGRSLVGMSCGRTTLPADGTACIFFLPTSRDSSACPDMVFSTCVRAIAVALMGAVSTKLKPTMLLLDLEESMRLDSGSHQRRGSVPRIMQRNYEVTGLGGWVPWLRGCPCVFWRVHQS